MADRKVIDCKNLTVSEKEEMFGKAFGLIEIISFEVVESVMLTKIKTDGAEIVLVGDPEKALHNYLLGKLSTKQ